MKGMPCRQLIKVLTDDQVEMIHEASLRILQTTGVRFDSEDARRRLAEAGAARHPDRKDVMTFPRNVVEEAVDSVPRDVTLTARDPEWTIRYDGERAFPYSGGGDPKIIDIETGAIRPSTYADVVDASRLGDALDNNHIISHLVVPNDVPTWMIELKTFEAAVRNSAKILCHHATSAEAVDYMVRIASRVVGGDEEFRKAPLFSLASSPSSPLTYADHVCEVLIRSAETGVPFSVIPCPIAGATGPATLSGSLALQNAEILAGLVLIQSVAPSLPSVYCGRVCFMDPRSGRDLWGVPEEGLVSAAMVQLARRYGMVSDAGGMASDVSAWGAQMGLERMMTSLVPMMAGAESISGMGGAWDGASSLEMMVIDDDAYDDIARIMRRFSHSDDGGGLDLGAHICGPGRPTTVRTAAERPQKGGNLAELREWEESRETTTDGGSGKAVDLARERVREILKDHSPIPLDRDVEEDIGRILKEAERLLPHG